MTKAPRADALDAAWQRWVLVVAAACVLFACVVAGAYVRRASVSSTLDVYVQAIGATDLAVVPAGRPPRGSAHPAVDRRFDPSLPLRSTP